MITEYAESQLQRLLAEDDRVSELGIRVVRMEGGFMLAGEVESPQRRDAICALVYEAFPELRIECDIAITRMNAPEEVEEL